MRQEFRPEGTGLYPNRWLDSLQRVYETGQLRGYGLFVLEISLPPLQQVFLSSFQE
jgi:hypothetical protein